MSYSPAGEQLSSVALTRQYGDIALLPDGTLYGVWFANNTNTLFRIDPETGVELATIPIIGAAAPAWNALSARPDGTLLLAAGSEQTVYSVDPATGVATTFATLPGTFTSAGDFLSLADGDVLAAVTGPSDALVRIKPDGTAFQIGTVPQSFGAAQSGGVVYLAGGNGTLYSVDALPTTTSTAPLATTTVAATGLGFYGATSLGDAGLCSDLVTSKSVDPAAGTAVVPGQELTYTLTFDNTNGRATAPVAYTDILEGVLDDATVTVAPAAPATSGLAVSAVSAAAPRGFDIIGQVPAGAVSSVTYTVQVDSPVTGDHVVGNFLIETGAPVPTACVAGDINCVSNPVADLTVAKTASPTTISAAGEAVTYSFLVTNTGQTPLTSVGVTETDFSGTGTAPVVTCPVTTLAIGAQTTCTATYTATQADADAGAIENTATAQGTPPGSTTPVASQESTARVTAPSAPALTVVKSASPSSEASFTVGQEVTYSFVVTNTGNVTLTDVTVEEGTFTGAGALSPVNCPAGAASLAPTASVTCTATYTLEQDDVDAGSVDNSATAEGTPPGSTTPVTSPPSTVTIPQVADPSLTVLKTASAQVLTAAGQTIDYSFLVTNTGNVTLNGVTVAEGTFSGTGRLSTPVCPAEASALLPGQSTTCTADYTVTSADVAAGTLSNTATAQGTAPGATTPTGSSPSTATVPGTPAGPSTPTNPPTNPPPVVTPVTPIAAPIKPSALAYTGFDGSILLTTGLVLLVAGTATTIAVRRRNA
ncbi:hypothetical protein ASG36_20225 [Geodermatophilus sp. Leaf369]|uniref:DUF7507 domain-containing protein n=1 Tax=Geodermatophilus sp. Leaf369 TaxID=1736354 RepID=UPI0006FBD369|nr:DUF11 domain-containing protein [Geodermatophilus sp. Leaf369]KQS54775.1 hypothetical protein ASG36_20225 [Geodermatophilus sp. Leaf369]